MFSGNLFVLEESQNKCDTWNKDALKNALLTERPNLAIVDRRTVFAYLLRKYVTMLEDFSYKFVHVNLHSS